MQIIWSEPYVPAAYSGIPFLAAFLAVPFLVEEACGRGGAHYNDRVIIFLEKKRGCHLRFARGRRGRLRRAAGGWWILL